MKKQLTICRDIKGKRYKAITDKLNFRPAVYAIVFREKSILLCKIWDGYDFPGGGVKKGELLNNALKREVYEETGLKLQPDKVVKVCEDFFISVESKKELHSILVYYLCKKPKGKINVKNLEEDEKKIYGYG